MKRFIVPLALVALASVSILSSCGSQSNPLGYADQYGYCDNSGIQSQLQNLPIETLSDTERASLLRMREEEKLAHDIYIVLFQKWGSPVFSNIASSEQTHMDAVLLLLKRYSIEDPASATLGQFNNPTLQGLYNELRDKGLSSLTDALTVGATIEDLDLSDLKMDASIDNADIHLVYDNLSRGSRNHMRAYVRNLSNQGSSYTPQYISLTEFNSIISSDVETGGCGR